MRNRILDFSEQGAYLKLYLDNLVVERQGKEITRIPLEDVAVLVLANEQVVITQAALASVLGHSGMVVICGPNKMPVGMTLPLQGNYIQTERFQQQIKVTKPVRKRLWQQIVRAKIKAQGELLHKIHGNDFGLFALSDRVKSGDTGNLESRAAVIYWKQLFKDEKFRRNTEAEDQNRLLNYGYAVLRSVVARSLCAAGLHLSLGLHHHNRYNAFVLADDIMEPFRPLVDVIVVDCVDRYGTQLQLTSKVKKEVISSILAPYRYNGEERSLFDWLSRISSSLVAVFSGEQRKMYLPEFSIYHVEAGRLFRV